MQLQLSGHIVLCLSYPFLLSLSYRNIDGIPMDVNPLYTGMEIRMCEYTLWDLRVILNTRPKLNQTIIRHLLLLLKQIPKAFVDSPKVQNGQISLDFKVSVYEDKGVSSSVVIAGDDEAPCSPLPIKDNISVHVLVFKT